MTLKVCLVRVPSKPEEEGTFRERPAQELRPSLISGCLGRRCPARTCRCDPSAKRTVGKTAKGRGPSLGPAASHPCQGGEGRCRLRTTSARAHSSSGGPWDLLWAPQESSVNGLAPTLPPLPSWGPTVASVETAPWCFAHLQAAGTGSHPETDPAGASPSLSGPQGSKHLPREETVMSHLGHTHVAAG